LFVVTENTPGYMPEAEPTEWDTFDEGVHYAKQIGNELEEQGYERQGTDQIAASDNNAYYRADYTNPDKIHDLGRVVEVTKI
jgi:hypothetical protein